MKLSLSIASLLVVPGILAFTVSSDQRILVVGSTGLVGSQVCAYLDSIHVNYKTVCSTPGKADYAIDLTDESTAVTKVEEAARGCTSVINCVGSFLLTEKDDAINAGPANAARGAKLAGVNRFVTIGNDKKVRSVSKSAISPLKSYAAGKEKAEAVIRELFPGTSSVIVQPTIIYGGEDLSLNPPRISTSMGQAMESILGLYPIKVASEQLPGIVGVVLGAPISREKVAQAAVHAALGLVDTATLGSRDEIVQAAAKRPFKQQKSKKSLSELKRELAEIGDCAGDERLLDEAFRILSEIESIGKRKPATDPALNGRWDFVFDIEADIGTGVVKDILEGRSPIKAVFDLQDLHMEIENNSNISIFVTTRVLGMVMKVRLQTTIRPQIGDDSGTIFYEKFESISIQNIALPIPDSWRQERYLEFTYIDDNMLIARGNGGEPHYLKRD